MVFNLWFRVDALLLPPTKSFLLTTAAACFILEEDVFISLVNLILAEEPS
jgi:hypothetical protein